jgi:large subunit ribosomal protein L10
MSRRLGQVSLTLEHKKEVVRDVAVIAARAHAAIAAEYRGLTVSQMTQLRVQARNAGIHMRVVRNTLARRALHGTSFECMSAGLVGPLVLAFSLEEPGAVARVMRDFARTNDKLVVRLVSFGGRLLRAEDLDVLARIPTREEALAKLAFVIKAPITKLVRTIAEPHSRLVRTLGAIRDQKQAA